MALVTGQAAIGFMLEVEEVDADAKCAKINMATALIDHILHSRRSIVDCLNDGKNLLNPKRIRYF